MATRIRWRGKIPHCLTERIRTTAALPDEVLRRSRQIEVEIRGVGFLQFEAQKEADLYWVVFRELIKFPNCLAFLFLVALGAFASVN